MKLTDFTVVPINDRGAIMALDCECVVVESGPHKGVVAIEAGQGETIGLPLLREPHEFVDGLAVLDLVKYKRTGRQDEAGRDIVAAA